MAESVLNGTIILAVDDELDALAAMEDEIKGACPNCFFDKVTNYKEATERMDSSFYDLVILDIVGVHGFDLLKNAVFRHLPTVMVTAHALTAEALRQSIELGARAYLPKEKMGEIIPFLEDVFKYENLPGWGRLLQSLAGFFNSRWGKDWKKHDEKFWGKFDEICINKTDFIPVISTVRLRIKQFQLVRKQLHFFLQLRICKYL